MVNQCCLIMDLFVGAPGNTSPPKMLLNLLLLAERHRIDLCMQREHPHAIPFDRPGIWSSNKSYCKTNSVYFSSLVTGDLFELCAIAYPCPLPRLMIEKDVAALFGLGANLYRLWIARVLRQPHHEFLVIPPIAVCATTLFSLYFVAKLAEKSEYGSLQLSRSKYLHDVPRLCVENPK